MEEVVAKKANMLPGFIVVAVVAALLIGVGCGIGFSTGEDGVIFLGAGVGGILAIFAAVQIVLYVRRPKNLITYCDGKFTFVGGVTCEPHEIKHVLLKLTRSRYGVVQSTGGMVITVGNDKIKINYIDHVKEAEERLSQICNEAAAAAQAEMAARMNAAQPQVEAANTAAQQPDTAPQTDEKDDDPFNL